MAAPVMAQGMAQPVSAQQVRVRQAPARKPRARARVISGPAGAKLPGPSARKGGVCVRLWETGGRAPLSSTCILTLVTAARSFFYTTRTPRLLPPKHPSFYSGACERRRALRRRRCLCSAAGGDATAGGDAAGPTPANRHLR